MSAYVLQFLAPMICNLCTFGAYVIQSNFERVQAAVGELRQDVSFPVLESGEFRPDNIFAEVSYSTGNDHYFCTYIYLFPMNLVDVVLYILTNNSMNEMFNTYGDWGALNSIRYRFFI